MLTTMGKLAVVLGSVFGVTAVTACGTVPNTALSHVVSASPTDESVIASADCLAARKVVEGFGTISSLDASYVSTAARVAQWQEHRSLGPSGEMASSEYASSRHAPDERVAVCFFDGSFTPKLPVPPGTPSQTYGRIAVTVEGGQTTYLYQVGSPTTMPTDGPSPA